MAWRTTDRDLLKEAERLRSVYASMDDLIFVLDADGIFVDYYQPAHRPDLYLPPEQFLGKTVGEVMPRRIASLADAAIDSARRTGAVQQFDYGLELGGNELFFNAMVSIRRGEAGEPTDSAVVVIRNITERARIEKALRQSESSLRFAQRVARMGSWDWNLAENTFTLSEEMLRLMGLEEGSSQQHSMQSLLRESVHPADRERIEEAAEAARADPEKGTDLTYRIVRVDGEIRWVTATAPSPRSVDENGNPTVLGGSIQDITERKRSEDTLRLHSQAMQQSFDGIARTDMNANVEFVNAAWAAMHGRTVEEFEGQHISICHPEEPTAEEVNPVLEATRDEKARIREVLHVTKDGTVFPTQMSVSVIRDDHGTAVGLIAVARDLSRERQLEAQLRHSQKMEAIGTLAGGIAHDFNNLLYIILGNTELAMADLPEASGVHGSLKEIRSAGKRAAKLVRRILDFSRRSEKTSERLLLQPALEEALGLLRATLPNTIDIRDSIDPDCGGVIIEESELHRVIVNLGTNAYRAMVERGGTLEVTLDCVTFDQEAAARFADLEAGEFARLVVRDTGHGMTDAVRERVFEPYYSTGEGREGTGLGLTTVHGIVRGCGGAVAVESEPGRGSTFTVLLPICPPDGAKRREEEEGADVDVRGDGRILFVDDEKQIVRWGKTALDRAGFQVEAYTDGLLALEAFRKRPDAFDVVVTDQTMPKLTGVDLAARILKIRPGLPVVLCTGYSEVVDEDAAAATGVKGFVRKPAELEDLVRAIKRALAT